MCRLFARVSCLEGWRKTGPGGSTSSVSGAGSCRVAVSDRHTHPVQLSMYIILNLAVFG